MARVDDVAGGRNELPARGAKPCEIPSIRWLLEAPPRRTESRPWDLNSKWHPGADGNDVCCPGWETDGIVTSTHLTAEAVMPSGLSPEEAATPPPEGGRVAASRGRKRMDGR